MQKLVHLRDIVSIKIWYGNKCSYEHVLFVLSMDTHEHLFKGSINILNMFLIFSKLIKLKLSSLFCFNKLQRFNFPYLCTRNPFPIFVCIKSHYNSKIVKIIIKCIIYFNIKIWFQKIWCATKFVILISNISKSRHLWIIVN